MEGKNKIRTRLFFYINFYRTLWLVVKVGGALIAAKRGGARVVVQPDRIIRFVLGWGKTSLSFLTAKSARKEELSFLKAKHGRRLIFGLFEEPCLPTLL